MEIKNLKCVTLFICLFLIVSSSGCSSRSGRETAEESKKPKTKEYTIGDIAFHVPKSWTLSEQGNSMTFYVSKHNTDRVLLVQKMLSLFGSVDLPIDKDTFENDCVKSYKNGIARNAKNVDFISSTITESDGFLIAEIVYYAELSDKEREFYDRLLIDNQTGSIYHFGVTVPRDYDSSDKKELASIFEDVMDSIYRKDDLGEHGKQEYEDYADERIKNHNDAIQDVIEAIEQA